MGKTALSAGLLALAAQASAQVARVCPTNNNVCFSLNIPQNTASSGNGDIFFSISAPSTYEWVGLGQGGAMSGANIFVVYTSSNGRNVTLSPRSASGYVMPTLNNGAQVTLLEGSGVSNGIMTANVRCSNCNSWSTGNMDFRSSSGNWIYAYQPSNGPKNSDDRSASIRQHTQHDTFRWDFTNAKGGNSVNPLLNSTPSSTGSGGTTVTSCIPRNAASATGAASASSAAPSPQSTGDDNNPNDDDRSSRLSSGFPTARPTSRPYGKRDGFAGHVEKRQQTLPFCDELPNNGNTGGFTSTGSGSMSSKRREMLIAHGVLASLAFVVFFPLGAIAIRLGSFTGLVWIHGAFQVFAYMVYIAAFGLGVYIACGLGRLGHYHPIIGIVVFAVLFFQPILGFMHHLMFKKHNGRTMWSHAHIWLGRTAIPLGIINGGLGMKLAESTNNSSKAGKIAYGVVAGVMGLAWLAAIVIGEKRRSATASPKYAHSQGSSGVETSEVPPTNGHSASK